MSSAKNMSKKISENIRKNLSGKYSQKRLDDTKQIAADTIKTASKRAIQKTTEATADLIVKKIANKFTNVSRSSTQNS